MIFALMPYSMENYALNPQKGAEKFQNHARQFLEHSTPARKKSAVGLLSI